jgi:hypothetical protein
MAVILLVLSGVAAGAQSVAPGSMDGMDMGTPKADSAPQQKPAGGMNDMDMMSHCKMMANGKDMDMAKCMEMMQKMHMGMMDKGTAVPAGTLRIVYGGKTVDLTVAELAALPHTTVTSANPHSKANETYSGVTLMELLKKAGVPEQPEGKDLSLYLVAEGTDGYKVVYSVAEVAPSTHDAAVIVADSMDGKSLAASGPLMLVATRETRRVRWVKNLNAIRVRAAE